MHAIFDRLIVERGSKPKVLVVDDQAVNIRLVHDLFKDEYDIVMATNGEQAISQCDAQMPDIILLDVVMPGIDGYEVCRILKSKPNTKNIPIIFLTSKTEDAEEILGFQLGAADCIAKPINQLVLSARLKTHLILKLQTDALRSMALIDGLTGIANRRRFDEQLQIDWRQCIRQEQPMSILMIDVDYFKQYNDLYGHLKGDECLVQIAKILKSVTQRPIDLVARYGGEEFVCILPNTDLKGAVKLAEQMLTKTRTQAIPQNKTNENSIVTISIGVASTIGTHGRSVDSLLEAADTQLYEAKTNGRDRLSAIKI
ncbi:diguanylate cyclase [Undibacterium macrobrachii]|uniref:diguanylate cyclase n=1 Tax=Undibacterium macrobrachii TaxID=1119058 RepID=A0ABQ2XBE6_9BURK|nr:diguanylate cyclase [Undibacterium macrobrachii]GGX08416.1 hypothetical protein GCM10011282_13120 [Undibacterium macrobrachii]